MTLFKIFSRSAWVLVAVVFLAPVARASDECVRAEAQVRVATRRNASGHWEARVQLQQEAEAPVRLPPLLLDVRPASSRCGRLRSHSLTLTLSGPPPVSPGYVELPGEGFYRLHEENVLWDESKKACEAEGTHLLILNSEAEAEAIRKLILKHPAATPWLHVGFSDQDTEGQYRTIFGETLAEAGYSRWYAGEPSSSNEDCGGINSKNIGFHDLNCVSQKFGFICEQDSG